MSDAFDGLSNVYSIQANIEALKNAQTNSSAALNSNNNNQVDPKTFLYQTELTFNQMLNSLVGSADEEKEDSSSDYFSFLSDSQNSSLSTADLQKLTAMEQYSPLIGRTVTYFDSATGVEKSGVIGKISFNDSSAPLLVLNDGTQLPAGAVTGLK